MTKRQKSHTLQYEQEKKLKDCIRFNRYQKHNKPKYYNFIWAVFIIAISVLFILAITESIDFAKEKPRGEMRIDK